jgi:quercetin dioxygenase-like cupin family protein
MAETTYKLTPSESVTVRRSETDVLEVEGSYGPNGKPPPAHYHPDQDEHFEVLEGSLRTKVDGKEELLEKGDTIDIPKGTPHQMWNDADEEARVKWETRPAGRTEEWFRSIDALYEDGTVESGDRASPLAFGVLLKEYEDVFRLAVGPEPVTKPVVNALAALGRIRGYRAGPADDA